MTSRCGNESYKPILKVVKWEVILNGMASRLLGLDQVVTIIVDDCSRDTSSNGLVYFPVAFVDDVETVKKANEFLEMGEHG